MLELSRVRKRAATFLVSATMAFWPAPSAADGNTHVTVMSGGPMVAAATFLFDANGLAVGNFLFVAQAKGFTAGTSDAGNASWFEALLGVRGQSLVDLHGTIAANGMEVDPEGGGRIRLDLGELGTADLNVIPLEEPSIGSCQDMEVWRFESQSDGAPTQIRTWRSITNMTTGRVVDVVGTLGEYSLSTREADRDGVPLASVSRTGINRTYHTKISPAPHEFETHSLSCVA